MSHGLDVPIPGAEVIQDEFENMKEKLIGSAHSKYTQERLFYEYKREGTLKKFQEQIKAAEESGIAREKLMETLAGDTFAAKAIENPEQAERDLETKKRENPEEFEQLAKQYEENPMLLHARVQSGEIGEQEAILMAQKFLSKHPSVERAAKTLGFPIESVAAGAAAILIKTGKIPQSGGDFLMGMKNSAEGLFHFKVTERASKAMRVEPGTLRSVYGINADDFVRIIESCEAIRNDNDKLEDMRKHADSSDKRRIITMYLDGKHLMDLNTLRNTIVKRREDALAELDKTFRKQALQEKINTSFSSIRAESEQFFRENVSVGKMIELLYSVKEDRETLLSYSAASLAFTLPRGIGAYTRLEALQNILGKGKADGITKLGEELEHLKSRPLAQVRRTAGMLAEESAHLLGRASKSGAEGYHQTEMASKGARRTTLAGKALRLAGPAAIIGSEFYNFQTGRSTAIESVGRVAGGMLRMVPIVGTGLDFSEAISGTDQLNGQKLQDSERIARVGWGVVGLVSDVAMLIPFAGPLIKGGVMAARAASIAKVARIGGLGVGIGAGVSPLLVSESGREAVGAGAAVAAGTAKATIGAIKLLSGSEGGAGDMMVATAKIKESVKEFGGNAREAVTEGAAKLSEVRGKLSEKLSQMVNRFTPALRDKFNSLKRKFSGQVQFEEMMGRYNEKTLNQFLDKESNLGRFSTLDQLEKAIEPYKEGR